jgi:hypothetical protein
MSPAVKYTLARIGVFLAVALALWPANLNIYLKLMLALVFSAAVSFLALRRWRDQMARQLADAVERRRAEKERLRTALAGDDRSPDRAADQAGGDRADADRAGADPADADRAGGDETGGKRPGPAG